MATSKVAIANGALQRLGAGRISALSQDHPNARTMNAAYERVLRAELRRYDWSFAIHRASIAADGDQTEWGGWNRYTLPNDFIRLIRDDETGQHTDWRIEGLYVVTADESPLEIRYIRFIDDPNYYDPLFIEAFECKLAFVACKDVTGSTELKESLDRDYKDAIAEAKKFGAIEKPAAEFPDDSWINSRL